jgi:hypothetical protein
VISRHRRPPAALAMAALIGVLSAGCGASAPSGTRTATAAAASKQLSARDQGVKFADCVRTHGVSDFPDPDAKGEFAYGVSVSPAVFRKAVDACKDLEPPGALSSKRTPKQQTTSLRFARCVRENGVQDFPDPVDGEPLINTYRIPSSSRPGGMTILNAAIETCRDLLDKAAAGQ